MILAKKLELSGDKQAACWLRAFVDCVRREDYEVAKILFAEQVKGFGTIAESVSGIELLEHEQWRKVWGRTKDFSLVEDSLSLVELEGGSSLVTGRWRSVIADRESKQRLGRMTLMLVRGGSHASGLVAVHSHFSKSPDGAL